MTPPQTPHTFEDINWSELHLKARSKKAWPSKKKEDWNKKASSFAKRARESVYSELFIKHLPLTKETTVLDIGAGSGALSLPIAQRVAKVTALDYSQGMIDELKVQAQLEQVSNIQTVNCAWEDDWEDRGIAPHDICIASRSMGVKDLQPALKKINNFASQYVFISDRINPTPFDAEAFKAIKRPFHAGPDYIFSLNMLYSMGIHAEMRIIEFDKDKEYANFKDAVDSYKWMFHHIEKQEIERLESYLRERIIDEQETHITIRQGSPHRWALISWKKEQHIE